MIHLRIYFNKVPFAGEVAANDGVCSCSPLVDCLDIDSTESRYVSLFGTGVDADISDIVSTCNEQG